MLMSESVTKIPHPLDPTSIEAVRNSFSQGNYSEAWSVLVRAGDRYADNVAVVSGESIDTLYLFFKTLVQYHWSNTGNFETYHTKFDTDHSSLPPFIRFNLSLL